MKKSPLFLIVCFAAFGSACNIKYDCFDTPISFNFVGFDSLAVNHFVIRKFPMNNGFNQVIDSVDVRGNSTYYYFQYNSDTVRLRLAGGADLLVANYEWEIYLPATGKTVRIDAINSEHETHERSRLGFDPVEVTCYNRVFSFKVDGQVVTPKYPEMPEFFIHK